MQNHGTQNGMTNGTQYWVVGGVYADTSFEQLDGKPNVYGPFCSYEDARHIWEKKTVESKPVALARFSIAVSKCAVVGEC